MAKCKFCEYTITESAYTVKHHLAGTNRDVLPCRMVPVKIKKAMQFLIWLELIERELIEMKRELVEIRNLF